MVVLVAVAVMVLAMVLIVIVVVMAIMMVVDAVNGNLGLFGWMSMMGNGRTGRSTNISKELLSNIYLNG